MAGRGQAGAGRAAKQPLAKKTGAKKTAPPAADGWPPAIGEAKVKAATGRGWMGWFVILNTMKATSLPHKEVAKRLRAEHGAPDWWAQTIAVAYERARGGRKKNERAGGTFAVNVTKVMPVALPKLFATATSEQTRKSWFPPGAFEETSKTKDKYWRGKWKSGSKLEFGFYAKAEGKSQIALEISKLASAADVEKQRAVWKKAMERLGEVLAS
jgi:hypothetical protein